MDPLTTLLYVVIITAITFANFILWLRFRTYQKELARQAIYVRDRIQYRQANNESS